MSYDLMAFEASNAPKTKAEFLEWYQKQTEWGEDHGCNDPANTSPALRALYAELSKAYPDMNGSLPDEVFEAAEEAGTLTDYSIGRDVLYAAFAWSQAEPAYGLMRELCRKHGVGFFDAGGAGADVYLPDGTRMGEREDKPEGGTPGAPEDGELARRMMEFLDCPCELFAPMEDDDPLMEAFRKAREEGRSQGYWPVLVTVDETLMECLLMNSDPDSDGEEGWAFDAARVADYRREVLESELPDGAAVLERLVEERRSEAEDDDMDWDGEILGEMEGGEEVDRLGSYWNFDTRLTNPVILAKIPAANPWEIFAWLPFGAWNECPGTGALMAAAKRWHELWGAVPVAISHDELEFMLPAPVEEPGAMDLALEQYGFCPDVIDQCPEDGTVGRLADTLCRSRIWYFWWD